MKFSSRKSPFFSILILGSVAFLVIISLFGPAFGWIEKQDYWVILVFAAISALLLWIYFGTKYELTDTELIYRSGPLRGKIEIARIREIKKGKTLYSGLKPATAGKGLIICFQKYDEIYISPKTNDSFIEEILKRNKAIVIS